MTIPAIRASWTASSEVSSLEATKFDAQLWTRVTDKSGDTMRGVYTITGSPAIGLGEDGAFVAANAPGAIIKTVSGGRIVLGDGDHVQLRPPRPRSILISMLEALPEQLSPTTISFVPSASPPGVQSTQAQAQQVIHVPLTRVHDGSTITKFTLFFFPQLNDPSLALLPKAFPKLEVFRLDATVKPKAESLSLFGPSVFTSPATADAYANTPAIGASGNITFAMIDLTASATINAGAILKHGSYSYTVTTGGKYFAGTPVPVRAVAPPAGIFHGSQTNLAPGTPLTWVTPPSGANPASLVDASGLTGGLDAGYAQVLEFACDPSLSVVDKSRYVYFARVTDDTAGQGSGWFSTLYSALRVDMTDINDLHWQ